MALDVSEQTNVEEKERKLAVRLEKLHPVAVAVAAATVVATAAAVAA